MDRIEKFKSLKTHAWYGRLFLQLSEENLAFCINFIQENHDLNKNAFEYAVNRMFIGKIPINEKKEDKKRRMICQELLASCS